MNQLRLPNSAEQAHGSPFSPLVPLTSPASRVNVFGVPHADLAGPESPKGDHARNIQRYMDESSQGPNADMAGPER